MIEFNSNNGSNKYDVVLITIYYYLDQKKKMLIEMQNLI